MSDNPKIFDILPPSEERKKQATKALEDNKVVEVGNKVTGKKRHQGSAFKKIVFALVILLAAFVLLSQFVFNKADVQIYPTIQDASTTANISVDTSKLATDISAVTIPGQSFEEETTVSQSFNSTGKSDSGQKATGIIRIYNNYSTKPQILVATTRLVSSSGKLFRTTKMITVPGEAYVNGKLQQGYIDVAVVAAEAGDSYNIGPDTFSIPGFAGTAKYTSFYGKSFSAMTGGSLGQVSLVTSDDITNAKNAVTASAESKGEADLKSKISSDFTVLDNAINYDVLSATSSAAAGDEAESFTYQVTVKTAVIAFRKSDMEYLSNELLTSQLAQGEEIKDGSLQSSCIANSVDQNGGKLALSCNLSAQSYLGINENELAGQLAGTSLTKAQQILSALPMVDKAQIKSWPFWANGIPKDVSKVKVELMLD